MAQKTIAVDIDDVLSASAAEFVRFSNERWGMQLSVEHYNEDFSKAWGVSLEEAMPMAELFLGSGVHGEFAHHEAAVPVLRDLGRRFKLIVVTSRRKSLKPQTDAWIERHFKDVFDEVVYAGIFDGVDKTSVRERLKQTKAQLCQSLRVDFLIDDQLKHCLAAADCGIQALLFGDYPWNRDISHKPELLAVVHTWQEVARYFDGKS